MALEMLEKLVQILICDEPEKGMENLHEVIMPQEMTNKFFKFDDKELEKNFIEN